MSNELNDLISIRGFDGVVKDLRDYAANQVMAALREPDHELADLWVEKGSIMIKSVEALEKLSTK